MNDISGKVILITGASSGIGEACAELFAQQGAKLILLARRYDRLQEVVLRLQNTYNSKIYFAELDVRDKESVNNCLSNLPIEFAKVDILLNNAGLALGLSHTVYSSLDNWENMIDTNLKGLLYVTKAILPSMYEHNSGHIINVGSIAGVEHYANASVYCATKSAVHAFTRSLREECIEHNIKVSEILPGMVNTEFSTVRFEGDKQKADSVYSGVEPLTANDIASIVSFIANLPAHVNLAESLILPTCQATPSKVFRK